MAYRKEKGQWKEEGEKGRKHNIRRERELGGGKGRRKWEDERFAEERKGGEKERGRDGRREQERKHYRVRRRETARDSTKKLE